MKLSKASILKEIFGYLIDRKKLFLAPIIIILVLLGLILVVTEGSVLAPFIYTLF